MSDKEFFAYNPAEAVQPEYCESHFIFKSLFPDLLPTVKLVLRCDDPNIDPNVFIRLKNAAYREFAVIMTERQNAEYGFHVCGSWDAKEGDEDADL